MTMNAYPEKNEAFQGPALFPPRQIDQTVLCPGLVLPVEKCIKCKF